MNETRQDTVKPAPFDTARLDALLEDEGMDVLVVTSKHNVQYLLGGYRFSFFDYMDAIGVSRYLPVVIYQKGRSDNSRGDGVRDRTGIPNGLARLARERRRRHLFQTAARTP